MGAALQFEAYEFLNVSFNTSVLTKDSVLVFFTGECVSGSEFFGYKKKLENNCCH
jgi:hypothetical protein